jgi:Tol biopolymer transport system component
MLLAMSAADHKPTVFHSTPFREAESTFSPDGKFLTYTSYESGRGEIFA